MYFESKEALFQQLYDSWDCGLAARIDAALARLQEQGSRSPSRVLEVIIATAGAHVRHDADLAIRNRSRTLRPTDPGHAPRTDG